MQSRILSVGRPGAPIRFTAPAAPAKMPDTLAGLVDLAPDLPALPSIALATYRETGRAGASAQSVGTLISTDPALTARVLRLANSAYYGVSRQVAAVPDAVMVLGMRGIRNLCLLAGTYPWLQSGLPAYGLAPGALLSHSLATALGAKAVAERMELEEEVAFTAGLLHDLGKVALSVWLKPTDGLIRTRADERRALKFDHAQVGGELARRWNLPLPLVSAIACHHVPCQGLEDATHLGDMIAQIMESDDPPKVETGSLERSNMPLEDLASMAEALKPEHARLMHLTEACS